jgi:hypothetical protein
MLRILTETEFNNFTKMMVVVEVQNPTLADFQYNGKYYCVE